MDEAALGRFSHVLSLAAEDEVYQKLQFHCEFLDEPVLAVLDKLPEVNRAVIRAYIRLTGASALRLAEIACEQSAPPEG